MGDDGVPDDDERHVELSSIAAIYPEIVFDPTKPFDAKLDIQVALTNPLRIRFIALADGAPPDPTSLHPAAAESPALQRTTNGDVVAEPVIEDIHPLKYLPPLSVQIHLPDGYPTEKPPVLKISTSPAWLPKQKIEDLIDDCVRLWEEYGRDQVLFACVDHLQQQSEAAFGMTASDADMFNVSKELKIALLDFDIKSQREEFEKGTFDCGICLEPKKGSSCHRMLRCSHVFCIVCLQDFYNNCISEGDVDNVKCLDPSCGKEEPSNAAEEPADPSHPRKRKRKSPTLNPSELLQIPLDTDVVQRYVHLKRKKKLESDMTTVYCPRQWCQGAAISKHHPKPMNPLADHNEEVSESEQEVETAKKPNQKTKTKKNKTDEEELPPMSERLRICEDCSYAFCCVCKKGWHGELVVCNPRKQEELNAEEKASEDYLKLHTTACPTCSAPSQKTMGCNHMICFKCKTHFCYLCSSFLMEENPYAHFNDHKSPCYMRLWELEAGDGDQTDHRFRGEFENWVDEGTDDEDTDADLDDASVHSGDSDELPDGPNWFLDPRQAFQHGEDSDSEDDIWPGLPPQPENAQPAARQDARIEIINFAHVGVRNPRHIALQDQILFRPHRLNNIRAGDLGNEIEAERNPRAEHVQRVAAAPGQGNEAALQPAPVRAMGLERFLQLARDNREDEWDSDELEEGPVGNDAGHNNW